jgi:hypothetical protein
VRQHHQHAGQSVDKGRGGITGAKEENNEVGEISSSASQHCISLHLTSFLLSPWFRCICVSFSCSACFIILLLLFLPLQVIMMRSILDDFLDMSKIESGILHFEKIGFELALLAKQCVQSMTTKAKEKGIRLRLRLNQVGLPRKGYADPTRIKQLILNLLTNAIKVREHARRNGRGTGEERGETQLRGRSQPLRVIQ